ncbi:hypothetical protein [Polymorphospora rubra]|uniref:hypothetical protein n=1 Tax=Polymorphospora rubra TaxID=338584 RepID=UPI0033F45A31
MAILSGQRLTAARLAALLPVSGPWTDYGTPTTIWTASGSNPTIGNGSIVARYQLLGGAASKTCAFRIKINPGSTTTFGRGTYSFLLPFDIADEQTASAIFRDNSAATQFGGSAWLQSARTIHSVALSSGTLWSPTVPAPWSQNDRAEISGIYERA